MVHQQREKEQVSNAKMTIYFYLNSKNQIKYCFVASNCPMKNNEMTI